MLYDGLFVTYYLLSDHRLSAEAKLLFVYLAGQVNARGEVYPDVDFIARLLGTEPFRVYAALNELQQCAYIATRRDRAGTRFVHCRLLPQDWLQTAEKDSADTPASPGKHKEGHRDGGSKVNRAGGTQSSQLSLAAGDNSGRGRARSSGGSKFPYEACKAWAEHCERRGDRFAHGIDYFAGWLFKFGGQDEDIEKFLRARPEIARRLGLEEMLAALKVG